jgi:cell division septal protein FtsQ
MAIVVTVAFAYLLGWSQIFTVKTIQVIGSPNAISEGDILKMSQVKIGGQLARVNIQSSKENLQEITWIREADISRNWIDGRIRISVKVREPIAYFNTDEIEGQTIDNQGELFVLPGFSNPELAIISSGTAEGALEANTLFTAFPLDFRRSITSMVATSPTSFVVNAKLKGRDIEIRWGDNSEMNLKISVIDRLLALPENKKVTMIDLLAPHAPIVAKKLSR